jgi:hypothetical protein
MPFTDVDQVRLAVGENIPADGGEADTMFTNAQIQNMLDASGGVVVKAALSGWQAKAAEYSNLVNVSEGNSQREMSDLYKAALKMVEYYEGLVAALEVTDDFEGKTGRVVIGEISRSKRYR